MVSWNDGEPECELEFKKKHCKGMDAKQYATKIFLCRFVTSIMLTSDQTGTPYGGENGRA